MAGSLPPLVPVAGYSALPLFGPRRCSETGSRRTDVCTAPLGDGQNGTDEDLGVPTILLMSAVVISTVVSTLFPSRVSVGLKWGILAAFFGLCVIALFSYLRNARTIDTGHLYTAVSTYLLLGMQWFALYSVIDVLSPGSIEGGAAAAGDRHAELLYFSLITLSTIGYGDVVPVRGEVRMLAALEGIAGVLYIAITVALLVSAYRPRANSA